MCLKSERHSEIFILKIIITVTLRQGFLTMMPGELRPCLPNPTGFFAAGLLLKKVLIWKFRKYPSDCFLMIVQRSVKVMESTGSKVVETTSSIHNAAYLF